MLNFINAYKIIKGKKEKKEREEVIWRMFDREPICVLK